MPETFTERLIALVGFATALGLVAFALGGRSEEPGRAAAEAEGSVPVVALARSPEPATAVARPTAAPVTPARARLVLTAARGECWVSIRAGSAEGRVLYEGVVAAGERVRYSAARLWIRLGAAANVELRANGKPVDTLSAGTFDIVVTPTGVKSA
jgi:hypothetical protein